jgi:hypothetical protein
MERKQKLEALIPSTASIHSGTNLVRENSRHHPRVKVSLPVTLVSGLDEIKGEIVDLSLTGAFMAVPELPDHTRPFKAIIDLPDGRVLILTAELVRFDLRPTGDNSSHFYGVAVRFMNVSEEDCFALLDASC